MAQRKSGYKVVEGETYITPKWVWDVLEREYPWLILDAVDPCPAYYKVDWRDVVSEGKDIASNPPFTQGQAIAEACLGNQACALLLPATWDCAKSRVDLCNNLDAKITLTRRIRWDNLEQKKNGPSSNHAWYVWTPNRASRRLIYR